MELNLYGNPYRTYCYLDGLLGYMQKEGFECNKHEICLVQLCTRHGTVIMAIAVDDFLAAESTQCAMDGLFTFLNARCQFKRLGRTKRYIGWHFHYTTNGEICFSQKLFIKKTLAGAGMDKVHARNTPYPAEGE